MENRSVKCRTVLKLFEVIQILETPKETQDWNTQGNSWIPPSMTWSAEVPWSSQLICFNLSSYIQVWAKNPTPYVLFRPVLAVRSRACLCESPSLTLLVAGSPRLASLYFLSLEWLLEHLHQQQQMTHSYWGLLLHVLSRDFLKWYRIKYRFFN